MNRRCDRCGDKERVKRFELFGEGEPGGVEILCWECRWPYIRKRVFGADATGPPGSVAVPETEPEPTRGQASLLDF